MTKRTVAFTLSVTGSAVVDVEHLLGMLKKADQHPWAKHLLSVHERLGADALVTAYIKQAYSGGVNSLLREWVTGLDTLEEHGGKAKFAPARCRAEVEPKP